MTTIKSYVCSVRFSIIVVFCVMVLGTIGYFAFANTHNESTADGAQSDHSTHDEHSSQHIDGDHDDHANFSATIAIPQIVLWEQDEEIKILRDYLRIPTPHPDIDYKPCVNFLQVLASNLNFSMQISYPADEQNPIVLMTWPGSQPELPTIVLNSHMDVVPVYEEFWTHPPFAAEMDNKGNIYARGAQDMKSVGMQYLAAIRALHRDGVQQLKRTIHVLFVPDEELGGRRGMAAFVKTDQFNSLNVGLLLDEGGPVESGPLGVLVGERTIWQIEFTFHGHSGHGSRLFNNTAGEKLNYVLNKFMEFRKEEMKKLNELRYPYGNVTTINLTKVKGGVENNVIPPEMSATFDIRISINVDLDEFEQMLRRWCDEAGGNITMNFAERGIKEEVTSIDSVYWQAFKNATNEIGIEVEPTIRIGASDSRFIRRLGIAALGFSPMPNTIPKLHEHNEYINAGTYLKGIDAYKKIIVNLGNLGNV
ncbi:aminoacylase-1A-like [Contarinia nasturtii]|uniref:aminoacylase-1A-like n=1 Tax=Contarinia nasturtii TaxID=265458 RepID=UPI0012D38569|nr:aminoacylase-1A-like [Contarinia nasturtii]